MGVRAENDSMGEMQVPDDALYGAQTARAVENFPVSGRGIGRDMIRALGQIKRTFAGIERPLTIISLKPIKNLNWFH